MSEEEEDEVNLLSPHKSDYAPSDPSSSPQRSRSIKRLTEDERLREDAIKYVNIGTLAYPYTTHRKHVSKRTLYKEEHNELSISLSDGEDLGADFDKDRLRDEEWQLIPKLPGQTSDDIRYPTREVFECIYTHFTETN